MDSALVVKMSDLQGFSGARSHVTHWPLGPPIK